MVSESIRKVAPAGPRPAQQGKILLYPVSASNMAPAVRRRITMQAGRGLEILGHAIEYLADEYALEMERYGSFDPTDPRLEAIRILKALSRKVHYSCPPVEPFWHRVKAWLWRPDSLHESQREK